MPRWMSSWEPVWSPLPRPGETRRLRTLQAAPSPHRRSCPRKPDSSVHAVREGELVPRSPTEVPPEPGRSAGNRAGAEVRCCRCRRTLRAPGTAQQTRVVFSRFFTFCVLSVRRVPRCGIGSGRMGVPLLVIRQVELADRWLTRLVSETARSSGGDDSPDSKSIKILARNGCRTSTSAL